MWIAIVCVVLSLIVLIIWYLYRPKYKKIEIRTNFKQFNAMREKIQKEISTQYKGSFAYHDDLREIIWNSIKSGKRVRPTILLSIAEKLHIDQEQLNSEIVPCAIAIEYLHASSLILDDIMDNDTERRGEKSIYSQYGIANSQMAAMALVTESGKLFQQSLKEKDPEVQECYRDELYSISSKLLNGQYLDVNHSAACDLAYLDEKTASLFELSFASVWLLCKGKKGLKRVRRLGLYFGRVFQLADDFEDLVQDVYKSTRHANANFVYTNGLDESLRLVKDAKEKINSIMKQKGISTPELREIVEYLYRKSYLYYKQWKEVGIKCKN